MKTVTCSLFVPEYTISAPIEKRMATAWIAIAAKSFHTSDTFNCRPENKVVIFMKAFNEKNEFRYTVFEL